MQKMMGLILSSTLSYWSFHCWPLMLLLIRSQDSNCPALSFRDLVRRHVHLLPCLHFRTDLLDLHLSHNQQHLHQVEHHSPVIRKLCQECPGQLQVPEYRGLLAYLKFQWAMILLLQPLVRDFQLVGPKLTLAGLGQVGPVLVVVEQVDWLELEGW